MVKFIKVKLNDLFMKETRFKLLSIFNLKKIREIIKKMIMIDKG